MQIICSMIKSKQKDFQAPLIALVYVFLFMALSAWMSFFNVYLEEIGFSGSRIGIINGIYWSTMVFVVPVWGMMADRFGTKRILLLVTVTAVLLISVMGFITSFVSLILFVLLLSLFFHPLGALTDSLAIYHVKNRNHLTYGKLRVWGSIGWGIAAISTGIMAAGRLQIIFMISSACLVMMFLMLLFLKGEQSHNNRVQINLITIKKVITQGKLGRFFLLIFLIGVIASPLQLFINLYFTEIGGDSQVVGLNFAIQSISEIPFFFIAYWLIRRFGDIRVLIITMVFTAIRLLLYGIISDPGIAVLLAFTHGITFSLFLVVIVEFIQKRIAPNLRATGQSLMWAFYFGAGLAIGNILNGWLKDLTSMQDVMKLSAAGIAVVIIAIVVLLRE